MGRISGFYQSLIGKKAVVACTGLVLLGFLVLHVIGNLKGFLPPGAGGEPDIDVYAHFLRNVGEPLIPHMVVLWGVRIVLGTALVLHVVTVLQLAAHNRGARPIPYRGAKHVAATTPARWMLVTGCAVLFFLIIHLLQFTFDALGPPIAPRASFGCVYQNLWEAFQHGGVLLFYVAGMTAVGLHVFHGAWSALQTLGIDNPDRNRGLRAFATGMALFLFLAFLSLPVAMALGVIPEPSAYSAACSANTG